MDLALSLGIGPGILANIDHLRPYVRVEDTVVFGTRDSADGHLRGQPPTSAGALDLEMPLVRITGPRATSHEAISHLSRPR
jgi:hypothetical protein